MKLIPNFNKKPTKILEENIAVNLYGLYLTNNLLGRAKAKPTMQNKKLMGWIL
jgi:hypothetical protein